MLKWFLFQIAYGGMGLILSGNFFIFLTIFVYFKTVGGEDEFDF